MSHCALTDFLFICGFRQFDFDVSRCGSLCFFLAWRLLSFMDVSVLFFFFKPIWKVFSYYFYEYFSTLFCFSGPSTGSMQVQFPVSHIILRFCSFFFPPFFSLFFRLYNLYQSIIKFTYSFFCQFKYTVEPVTEFVFSVIIFSFRIFFLQVLSLY